MPILLAILYILLFVPIAFGANVNYPGGIQAAQPAGCVRFDKTTYPYTFQSTGLPCNEANAIEAKEFAELGTPSNGTMYYCSDCAESNPCSGSGTGAFAERVNGAWRCAVTATVTAGDYIDVTSGEVDVDPSEMNDITYGDGTSEVEIAVIYNPSGGANNPRFEYRDNEYEISTGTTYIKDGDLVLSDPTLSGEIRYDSATQSLVASGTGLILATDGDSADNFFSGGSVDLGEGGTNQTSWTSAKCVRVNDAGTALESAPNDCGSGSGSSIILDLGDDGGNDSTALGEIAITGDTNSIFTEPSADKLRIAVGNDWPKADTSDDLTCNDCIGGTEIDESTLSAVPAANDLTSCANCIGGPEIDESTLAAVPAANDLTSCTDCIGGNEIDESALVGFVTALGPSCSAGDCWTDGVATTGSELMIFEGSTVDANEYHLTVPTSDPPGDLFWAFPAVNGTIVTTGDTDTVTNTMLAPGAVGLSEMSTNDFGDWSCTSGTSCTLDTGAVTSGKIASNAVDNSKVADGSLVWADLNTNITNPTGANLGANAVYFGTNFLFMEGATNDGNEGFLTLTDPTADRTWTLPDQDGTIMLDAGQGLTQSGGTVTWAPSEETNVTWSAGGSSTATHTFSLSGSNDPRTVAGDSVYRVGSTGDFTFALDDTDISAGAVEDATNLLICGAGPACNYWIGHSLSTGGGTTGWMIRGNSGGTIDIGDSNAGDVEIITNGTGDSEVVLPASSIGTSELGDNIITEAKLNSSDTPSSGECVKIAAGDTTAFEYGACGSGGGMTSFILAGSTGTQTVEDGETLTVAAGSGIASTAVTATNTVTIVATDTSATNEIEVVDETYNSTNFDGGTTSAVSQDDFFDYNHVGDVDDDGLNDALENTVTLGTVADGSASMTVVSSDANDITLAFDDAVMQVTSQGTPRLSLNDLDQTGSNDAIWQTSCSAGVSCNTDHQRLVSGSLVSYLNATAAGAVIVGSSGTTNITLATDGTGTGEILLSPLTSNGFVKTNSGTGSLSVDTTTYLSAEVDGSTTNEIEVVDEAFSAANFNGGTTSAVSQDDFYDYVTIGDADEDGLIQRIDTTSNGFVKTGSGNGTLSISSTVGDTEIANDAVDGGSGGEIADNSITTDDIATSGVGTDEIADGVVIKDDMSTAYNASLESFRHIGSTDDRYYLAGQASNTTLTATNPVYAAGNSTIYAIPFYTGNRGGTLDRLAFNITSNPVTGNCRMCLYTNTSQTVLYPNALVSGSDSGSIDVSTGTIKTATVNISLARDELYWQTLICEVTSGALTLTYVNAGGMYPIFGVTTFATGNTGTHITKTGQTYGACASTFPATGSITQAPAPALGRRYSG